MPSRGQRGAIFFTPSKALFLSFSACLAENPDLFLLQKVLAALVRARCFTSFSSEAISPAQLIRIAQAGAGDSRFLRRTHLIIPLA